MQQHLAAFHMAQKARAKSRTLRRTFNEARQVGQHKFFGRVQAHHAKLGMQRGEGVIRNLGPRGGNRSQKGGFAGIGQAHQPGISNQFQA